jgi:hypothetical protein
MKNILHFYNSGNVIFSSNEDEETYDNLIFLCRPPHLLMFSTKLGNPKKSWKK